MGLGNQMFQYAAARALSLEKNVPLKVDIRSYEGYSRREYELEKFFNLQTEKATIAECDSYYYAHPVKKTWNKIFPNNKIREYTLPYDERGTKRFLLMSYDKIFPPYKRSTYIEPHYHYDENFLSTSSNVYLQGFWMSWRYFSKYDTIIRRDFTFRHNMVERLKSFAAKLQNETSVSLHIRRTDFAAPGMLQLKGLLPPSYYGKAIELLQSKFSDAVFYIFSDDLNWVKENIQVENVQLKFIDKSVASSPLDDFYLLSQCRHNIIANSTFSWWAAYLNNNPDKIVVAPKKWYVHPSINCKDVFPPLWTVMDN